MRWHFDPPMQRTISVLQYCMINSLSNAVTISSTVSSSTTHKDIAY